MSVVSETVGAMLIGYLVMTIIYGITMGQLYVYLRDNTKDTTSFRYILMFLGFLDTIHEFLVGSGLYLYLVRAHGDFLVLAEGNWCIIMQALPSTIAIGIVQGIWINRIRVLSTWNCRRYLCCGVYALIIAQSAILFGFTIKVWAARRNPYAEEEVNWSWAVALGLMLCNDAVSLGSLTYLLYKAKRGIHHLDSVVGGWVRELIGFAITIGCVACISTVGLFVTISLAPTKSYSLAIYFVTSKVYTMGLLSILNQRKTLVPSTTRPSVPLELSTILPFGSIISQDTSEV